MNVLLRYLILVLFLATSVNSFNVCNVDISTPGLIVNDTLNNKEIFIIDNQGDMYFEGKDHTLNNNGTEKSFQIGGMFFNRITSKFSGFTQDLGTVPNASLVIRNNSGFDVASFSNTGQIYTKGKGAYQGSQGGCSNDGNYCSGNVVENRDYYCNITGSKTGNCNHNVLSTDNCGTKLSVDTDGGINSLVAGTVTDYNGSCSSGACQYDNFSDYCSSGVNLNEYYPSGSSHLSTNINCHIHDSLYCSGTNVYTTNYGCGGGTCNFLGNSFVQSCTASADTYSGWSCSNINTKVRTITTYWPTCSGGVCSQGASSYSDYQSCAGTQYCGGGSCHTITYSWRIGGWSACSASCGGGTTSRSVWCARDYDNAAVSSAYCGGAVPLSVDSCNLGPCCVESSPLKYNCEVYSYAGWGACLDIPCGTGSYTSTSYTQCSDYGTCWGDGTHDTGNYYNCQKNMVCTSPTTYNCNSVAYAGWGACEAIPCGMGYTSTLFSVCSDYATCWGDGTHDTGNYYTCAPN